MRKLIGCALIPAFFPVLSSVSRTISSRILLKSWNFSPGRCKNSPHSSALLAPSVEGADPAMHEEAEAQS